MIWPTSEKMRAAREAAKRINKAGKGVKGRAVAEWAKRVHEMLGTKPAERRPNLELVG